MIIRTKSGGSPNNFCKAIALVAATTLRENPRAMQWFRMKHKPFFLIILALSLGAPLAVWMLASVRPSDWLARRLQLQLEQAEKEHVDVYAQQLAALGEPGWKPLLAALHSDRSEVRLAARHAITEMVDSWRSFSTDVSAPKVAQLVRQLVENLNRANTDEVHFYADLAERLLAWPSSGGDGTSYVYDCEQIVRAARKSGWPLPKIAEQPEPSVTASEQVPVVVEPANVVLPNTASAVEIVEPSLTGPISISDSAPEIATESISSNSESNVKDVESMPSLSSDESPLVSQAVSSAAQPIDPEPIAAVQPNWPRLEVTEILGLLSNEQFSAGAEGELKRRGFDAVNLRVARAAADANPENRLKLIHLLPELSGVDAIGWLLLLAKDKSPRVRFTAIQLLSTGNDARIQRHLQQLDETETDEAVRTVLRERMRR
jgi:hypothetical protein